MLAVNDLNAYYGGAHILQGIDVKVGAQQRVAIVGRNGVGKSTLLKSIMNAGPRVVGDVALDGSRLGSLPEFKRARMGMALVPEDRRILTHLTVLENLTMAARAVPKDRKALDPEEVLNRFEMLVPLRDRLSGRLSGGQQQMLAVARAIVSKPRVMLLDEPTEGLAPVIVQLLAQEVVKCCEESGAALLLCEQNLWFARRCTQYLYVLDSGRVVFEGTWQEFDENEHIKHRYLSV